MSRRRRPRVAPVGYQHGARARTLTRFPTLYWSYYFLFSHLTLRMCAVGLFVVMPSVFLLWTGIGGPALHVGFAALTATAVSMAVGLASLPRDIQVTCDMPRRVERGSRFEIRYHIRNAGRRCARDLVVEALIYSDYFQYRLRRPALQWLAPGEEAFLTGGGIALARGVFTLPALRWDTAFPLGFWRWGQSNPAERLLYVYPRYQRLQSLDMPSGPRWQTGQHAAAQATREALEFAGCREYREGDAMRHVHPRSSARLGFPVVKEYQTSGRPRTALLVDTKTPRWRWRWRRLPRGATDILEAALSLAAAVAEAIERDGGTLQLLVADAQSLADAHQGDSFEDILDALAGVEPPSGDPIERLAPLLLDHIHSNPSAFLILTDWDENRQRLHAALDTEAIGVKTILLTPDGHSPPNLPGDVAVVSAAAVAAGKLVAL